MFIGSLLPFVSYRDAFTGDVVPGARLASAAFGAVLFGLALVARSPTRSRVRNGLLLAGGILGALGYGIFILAGLVGIEQETTPAFSYTSRTTVHFDPNIGVTGCLAGCIAVAAAAIQALRRR